jgi:hypothetical protein
MNIIHLIDGKEYYVPDVKVEVILEMSKHVRSIFSNLYSLDSFRCYSNNNRYLVKIEKEGIIE